MAVDVESWRMDRLLDLCNEQGFEIRMPESPSNPSIGCSGSRGDGCFAALTMDDAVQMAIDYLESRDV